MKAIIFDFDGTLTKSKKGSNAWVRIWEKIDDRDYDNYLYGLFSSGQIDDKEWFKMIFDRYAEKGVNRNMIEEISQSVELIYGIKETFEVANKEGIKIYILSGGIRQIIDCVLERENLLDYVSSIEAYDLIFDNTGNITGYNYPEHNLESKNEFIEILKSENGFSADEILFVGNGKNDEDVYKSGVRTLCINPDDADFNNRIYWTYAIEECNDLTKILDFVNRG